MQNPSNQNPVREKKENSRVEAVLRKIKSILLENWGTKLLAILIAVALWAGLITQDPTLTREKLFTDAAVTVNGEDTLKRYGFIVLEDIDEVLSGVDVRVNVPQGQYNAAQPSNYAIRVELSRLRKAGEHEVKIQSTNSSVYGTVAEIVPASVKLTVDEYVTRYRIPVTVATSGELPEGTYATVPSTDPPMIAVSGPKSVVERIVSARVVADQTTLPLQEGKVRRALTFTLVDEAGEEIQSNMLEVTSESVLLDSIIVEQEIYSQRTVEFSDLGLVTGEPAEGYEIKGVYLTPGSVTIAGRADAISDINVMYADNTVNVRGATESVTKTLKVRQPSTIKYSSTDSVIVAVEIGPIITTRAYETAVALQGLSAALREMGGLRTATVHLTGPQPWLDSLSASDVTLSCDLSTIDGPGTYTLPLTCSVAGSEGQNYTVEIVPASVVVTVIER